MKNKTKDKIIITLFVVLAIILFYCIIDFTFFKVFGRVIEVNAATGTKYIDRGNYTEIVYRDGSSHTIGNSKTEYENNIIGE